MQHNYATYIFIVIVLSIGKTYRAFVPRETMYCLHAASHNDMLHCIILQRSIVHCNIKKSLVCVLSVA
jgi:hypothetical protein